MERAKLRDELRNTYPKGTKVKLLSMDDPQAPPSGTIGTVTCVDDAATIHVNWETGSSLGLIVGEDSFEIVKEKNNIENNNMA